MSVSKPKVHSTRRRPIWQYAGIAIVVVMSGALIGIFVHDLRMASNGPREQRAACLSNLRKISFAILQYTQSNQGQYPPSLESLVVSGRLKPETLICPCSGETPASGDTASQVAADLQKPGHCSYIYLGKGMNEATTPKNAVIAYELLTDLGSYRKCILVLYGDGHDDVEDASTSATILARTVATTRPVTVP